MISLVTSVVGAAPLGGVTLGSLDSAPVVGVLTVVVGVVGVLAVVGVVSPLTCGTELVSDSLPTVIPLPPLEPQPAISAAVQSAGTTSPRRARECLGKCE